jgi:hypothetical protein
VTAVFINYRTGDQPAAAAYIEQGLSHRFGRDAIFRASRSIPPSENFEETILAAVHGADVLLAVIGQGWLTAAGRHGRRMIDDEHDWVRREIVEALDHGVRVVPVLVDGSPRLDAGALPAALQPLARCQYLRWDHRTSDHDLARITAELLRLSPALTAATWLEEDLEPPEAISQPSALLRAEYQVVAFEPRGQEFADLLAWAEGPARIAVRLVTGPAGAGKSRTAYQLWATLRQAGWIGGRFSERTLIGEVERIADLNRPLLLVLDRAESRTAHVAELASILARRRPADPVPRRLLLLGRAAGEWLRTLREHDDDSIAALFGQDLEYRLPPLTNVPAEREAEFDRARQCFAERLGTRPPAAGRPTDLATARYATVLDVHAAALATVLPQEPADRAGEAVPSPIIRMLHHERRYRDAAAGAYHLPDPHPRRLNAVAAAATLYGADSEPSARRLLRSLPTFEQQPADVVDRYVRWAHDLYPGPHVLNGLYPALLGEYDVAHALAEQPDIAFAPADDNQAARALTVLGRAAVRHEPAAAAIVTMLTGDPARLVPLGISVALQLEDSGPFSKAMTEAVTGPAAGDALDVALRHLPDRTVALAGFARDVIGAALRSHLARPDPHPAVTAYLHSQLAVRLGDAGEDEKALAASTESTTLYRQLVDEGQVALRPHLAIAVSNHAILLGRAGRRRESLEAAESAVAFFRELAGDRADKYEPYLAKALDNLSICLAGANRNAEAFEMNARALEIYKRRSGSMTPVHLASALSNQAALLRRAGRDTEAQESGTAAAMTFARLAAGQPDAFLRPLAISLDGDILAALLRQAGIASENVTAADVRRLAATITMSVPVREEFIDAVIRGCVPVWDDPAASPPDELAMRWGSWTIDLGQEPIRQALLEAIAATALVSAGIVDVDVGWTACVLPAVITAIEPADLVGDGPLALTLVLRDQARAGEADLYAGLPTQVRDMVNAQDFTEFAGVLRVRAGANGRLTLPVSSQVTLKPGEAQE